MSIRISFRGYSAVVTGGTEGGGRGIQGYAHFFMLTDNKLPATTPLLRARIRGGVSRHLYALFLPPTPSVVRVFERRGFLITHMPFACYQPPPSLAFSSGGDFLLFLVFNILFTYLVVLFLYLVSI